ncbi:MAG: MFS transporter [Anaerolineales bacterium]|nr:MFS transporter [Anaerolineales bacterium]MCX7753932.1 MFS transporter [Anaerolineales bacterium]MDW8278011.1 MFS transporter [Anaerolineales bacterium]
MTVQTASRSLRWFDYLPININWFAITLRSQVLAGLVVPLLVQEFVGESQKGAYFGTLRLWGLMVALLAQALFGLLSDRSRLRWGRRRPFILIGTVLEVLVILGLAWVAGLEGLTGYAVLFSAYLASMVLANMSHAATQGLIPDVVPPEKRGIASGLKMLLEIPLPLVLVGLVVTPMVSGGHLLTALLVTAAAMLTCMGLTLFVQEPPLETAPPPLDWKPFLSLVLMTAIFTATVLGLGEIVRLSIAAWPQASHLAFGAIGVTAMIVAVVVGIFLALSVHLDSSVRQNKPFLWFIVSRLAALVAINNISSFLLYFFQEKFDMPVKQALSLAGQMPMVLGGFIILFGLVAGWLADRFDRRLLTATGGLIGALGVAVMVFGPNLPLMYVAAALIGLAYALFNVSSWALGTSILPQARAGEFLGLQNLAGAGAGAIGAYIGGRIADQSGYLLLMGMFGVMFLLSAGAAMLIRIEKQ